MKYLHYHGIMTLPGKLGKDKIEIIGEFASLIGMGMRTFHISLESFSVLT